MPTTSYLAVTVLGGWLPIAVFTILTIAATVAGGLHLGRTHHGPRHDDRGMASDVAEFAAFRSALRPAIAPLRVDDRPSVVLHPTGPDPSQR
ncbi:MAG: hypothetical protein JWL73_351 [Actinomycetia bacterium]|nr:hypothetical protein [Actinomycetes bacterium]